MKIAIYARVSTAAQTADMQTEELTNFARLKYPEAEIVSYVDQGVSGAKRSRPALDILMEEAWTGKFSVVMVWRFDRFARSVSHLLQALETFQSLGIEFISLRDHVDTSTPAGKMVFTVLAAVAELERSLIAERVRAGVRNARAKGIRLGRPKKEVRPEVIRRLLASGMSMRRAAKELGVGAATLMRRLRDAKIKQG